MQRRKLEELNLLDDFLFGSMVSYPGIGEKFVRILLTVIFGREFGHLKVIAQKHYYGTDTDKHGARLDVYMEDETPDAVTDCPSIYDVEPDQNSSTESVAALPKRIRFYHAIINSGSLASGAEYRLLKNVIVILIVPYDPFGKDRMVYTLKTACVEEPDMSYEDGARTMLLYTGGTKGNPSKELRELLHYMEETVPANACSGRLREIQQMVEKVKRDKEVSLNYMKSYEHDEMMREQGKREERANTERERLRAEKAEEQAEKEKERAEKEKERAEAAEQQVAEISRELLQVRAELEELKKHMQREN